MSEEEKEALEILNNTEWDGFMITIKKIIETQKAEIEKRDKMIDLMIDTILENDDNYWYLFDANKKAVEEYFTKLVEGEKK